MPLSVKYTLEIYSATRAESTRTSEPDMCSRPVAKAVPVCYFCSPTTMSPNWTASAVEELARGRVLRPGGGKHSLDRRTVVASCVNGEIAGIGVAGPGVVAGGVDLGLLPWIEGGGRVEGDPAIDVALGRARELRQNPSWMIHDVEAGETYSLTLHGRRVGRIVCKT